MRLCAGIVPGSSLTIARESSDERGLPRWERGQLCFIGDWVFEGLMTSSLALLGEIVIERAFCAGACEVCRDVR